MLSVSPDSVTALKLFMQLSSAMHAHASVQDSSFLLQIHSAPQHADALQLQVVSSSKPLGAESRVIKIGFNVSFSASHPLSVGEGSAYIATSAFFQTSV